LQQENYRKKKTPTTSTGSSTGRNKTPTAKKLGDKKTLDPTVRGNTSTRRGRHGASPPRRTELTEFSLSLEISNLLSLERKV